MLKRISYLIFITLLSTLLFACGGGGGGGGSSVVDDVAPTISALSPADGATGVELTATLSATFNENMFTTTFDTGSFSFSDSNGTLAGVVNFDALTNIATFTPDKPLVLLTGYTASLSGDITDLSGNALSAESWSFTSRDGIWGTAALIETDDTGDASVPQIAFDANGNAMAVWMQKNNDDRTDIWANRYTAGSWDGADVIDGGNSNASQPQVVVVNNYALAVWAQSDYIRASRHDYDGSSRIWEPIKTIYHANPDDPLGGIIISDPQIAMNARGVAMAVWKQDDGGSYSILASRRSSATGEWSGINRLDSASLSDANSPQVAIDASGNALVVWQEGNGIWVNRYTVKGSRWRPAENIGKDDYSPAFKPQVAMDANGNALAIWVQSSSIWVNRYIAGSDVGSGWGTAKDINTDSNGRNADYPQISVNANGIAIAVWEQLDAGGSYSIRVRHYTPDDDWGDTELVESLTDNAHRPQIAIDTNGNALAVWQQTSGTPNSSIWVNRYTPSGGWGDAELIEYGNAGSANDPQIAIDANGKALAVFSESDGSRFNIEANRFE